MKKTLLLFASAALLLAGCAKEQFAGQVEGGLTEVTFTANLGNGVATKADADNDGDGTNVNRCIMEIYFQNQLYKRLEQTVTPASGEAKAYATFSNVPVVAGKQYQILFWADCGNGTGDKYYTTPDLKTVTVAKTAFLAALVAGKNDELDAFFGADDYTVTPSDNSFSITLYRPFAQLNVITTDVGANKTVTSAALLPEKVSVSYKADNAINVATGETSKVGQTEADYTFAYEAPVYGSTTGWDAVKTRGELTLSMDYILASTEQGAVDVTFKTKNGGTIVMNHALTNLPFKRNYRTNVKGELLTVGGTWTATIDADWLEPDIVKVVEVADIKSANEIIEQYAETTKNLEVKFVGVPNDSGVPTGVAGSKFRAILTSPLQQGANLGIEVMTNTNTLYVGDYINEYKVSAETGETVDDYIDNNAKQATVNINVPANSGIQTLIINAPSKTVYVNGQLANNVGEITNIDAITSQNTLIIEPGQTVSTLTMRQGGLEIHGTLGKAIVPEGTPIDNIKVRDCENLDEELVYNVLKPYIVEGYVGVKGRSTEGLWDIVPIVCKIGEIGYGSLADAVAAVPETDVETTITMVGDDYYEVNNPITIGTELNVVLDLNGKTVSAVAPSGTGSALITNKGKLTIKDSGSEGKLLMLANSPDGREIPGYASNTVTNYGTLVVNSGTLQNETQSSDGSACYPIDNVTNGGLYSPTVEINGGRFITKSNAALRLFCNSTTNDNNVTINGGYFEAVYYALQIRSSNTNANKGAVVINNGEFEATDNAYNCSVVCWNGNSEAISLTINGGNFNDYVVSTAGTNNIYGGLFKYDKFTDPDDGTQYKLADYVAEKYDLTENTDAATKAEYPWTVDRKHVAMIGSTKYYTLADAVADVPTNGAETTITMIADHEILGNAGVTVAATQNIILDLAGYTVKNLVNENKASQVILNKGKLKIIDTAGDGLITNAAAEGTQTGEWWSKPQYNYATNVISNYGNLTIDGANLFETATSSICYAIDNNSNGVDATCTIKSGHIYTLASTAIRMFCNSTTKMNTINVEGGLIEGGYAGIWTQLPGSSPEKKKATLNISGGTLKGTYAWYDYSYGDLYDEVKVIITGGVFDGSIFTYGADIKISDGVFKSDVWIEKHSSSNTSVSITRGKFDDYVIINRNASLTGGLFKYTTYIDSEEGNKEYKLSDHVAEGYKLTENTDEQTKAEYPWTVIKNNQQ